jgi:two-component system chemotaxis sensor kinase CheA
MDKLLEIFIAESKELLDGSDVLILDIEKNKRLEDINSLFRIIHTIKGNSGLFNYKKLTDFAHELEKLLVMSRNSEIEITSDLIDTLLMSMDAISEMVNDLEKLDLVNLSKELSLIESLTGEKKSQIKSEAVKNDVETQSLISNKKVQPASIQLPENAVEKNDSIKKEVISIELLICKLEKEYNEEDAFNLSDLVSQLKISESEKQIFSEIITLLEKEKKPLNQTIVDNALLKLDSIGSSYLLHENINKIPEKITEPLYVKSAENKTVASTRDDSENKGKVLDKQSDTYIKVSSSLLSRLMNLASESVIARNEILTAIKDNQKSRLHSSAKQLASLISSIQESVMQTNMEELSTVFAKVPRIVRSIEKTMNKIVEVNISGGSLEIDRQLVEKLTDPITHLVRNSIDHGIEKPETRREKGKSEKGMVEISAEMKGGSIVISIVDDGAGFNVTKIKNKAVSKNIISNKTADSMSDEEAINLIFEPGFSTSDTVTDVSGRGVGMDVVRTNIIAAGGNVHAQNSAKGGAIVTLVLPQTLSVITSLIIQINDNAYALPLQNAKRLIPFNENDMTILESQLLYNTGDGIIPLLTPSQMFSGINRSSYQNICVVHSGQYRYAIFLDSVISTEEIVVKKLGSKLKDHQSFSGGAIMGNGRAQLVLDIEGIARKNNLSFFTDQNLTEESDDENTYLVNLLSFSYYNINYLVSSELKPRVHKNNFGDVKQMGKLYTLVENNQIIYPLFLDHYTNLYEEKYTIPKQFYSIIFKYNEYNIALVSETIPEVIEKVKIDEVEAGVDSAVSGSAVVNKQGAYIIDIKTLITRFASCYQDYMLVAMEHE